MKSIKHKNQETIIAFLTDKKILIELKNLLNKKYPGLIDKIILYGSRVKGSANKFSDYDVLIILKKNYDWRFEKEIQNTCWEIDYKYDILTDVKIISKNELNQIRGKQLYILHALEKGVLI